MNKISIFCDGGARGNPGPAASAFVAYDSDNNTLKEGSIYLGKTTNNVAEYKSLILALTWLSKQKGDGEVSITLDSQLVYKQVKGEFKVKNKNLQTLLMEVKDLERKIDQPISYHWSPRSGNKRADFLVNENLDSHL